MTKFCAHCGTAMEERVWEGKPRPVCPRCGYVAFRDPKVAATVLAERAGALLLVRRAIEPARGLWCFPGGYVDADEDPMEAARRECHEEAGLLVDDLRLLDVSFNGRVIVITYHALLAEGEAVAGDDADMAAWFLPTDFPPIAFESVERAIACWLARRTPPMT
jgi:8-oxo-dGTP diphosphatase